VGTGFSSILSTIRASLGASRPALFLGDLFQRVLDAAPHLAAGPLGLTYTKRSASVTITNSQFALTACVCA
jgi:hypothetical protein